jgi:hypothetical protein
MLDILGLMLVSATAAFGLAYWLGRRLEAADWRDKAEDSTAHFSDGRFFYVRTESEYVQMNNDAARFRQRERGQSGSLRA